MEINKIKKLTTLAETKFLSMYKADYVNKSGKEKSWIIASRKTKEDLSEQYFNGKEGKVDAVVVLGFHKEEKKLIIIKQFRVPLNDYIYELPAGLIDPEENIFTTVER
ncbi:MAG: DNA mismatch repair protein MutT, partial [Clostridium celatum]|nr:DNA mismatch repair protein MutT [Clostridium celatum]